MSHTELLDIYLFSQKSFKQIKTKTWVRLEKYLKEYVVSEENRNHRDRRLSGKSLCAKLNCSSLFKDINQRRNSLSTLGF